MGMEPKGRQKVINVYLEDGRVMKCTPNHKFLTVKNGEYAWIEASNLEIGGGMKVVCGLEMPLDEPEKDANSQWSLESADYIFDMSTPLNREKSLAFARILGYSMAEDSVHTF